MAPTSPTPKKKVPFLLLLILGCTLGPLPVVGAFVGFWWAGNDARAFVRGRFAEVREHPDTFVEEAPDSDTAKAYELIAKSSEESIFPLSQSATTATSTSDWETRVCINPDLTVKGKTRTIGVLVVEKTVSGKKTMEIRAMSLTRSCNCNDRRKSCRLE